MSGSRTIEPAGGPLKGELSVPGDKSIGHRAVLLNALAEGRAKATGLPDGQDVLSTVAAVRALGAEVAFEDATTAVIEGKGLALSAPPGEIDCGNSGTTMRLLMGVLAGQRFDSCLVGDASLSKRPMERVADPLRELGASIKTDAGHAPVRISAATLRSGGVDTRVPSAQVKSALLLAGLQADGETAVTEAEPTRDHTERMLAAMGIAVATNAGTVRVTGGRAPSAVDVAVPGDASSAAFFAVAASLVPGSEIRIAGVGANPGRTGFLDVLGRMGADVARENERTVAGEPVADLVVRSAELRGTEIGGSEIPACIDELPILAVAGAAASGTTTIRDAGELRVKESDRIAAVVAMLRALGVVVEEREDGMVIEGGTLREAGTIETFHDHRLAMSASVAALVAPAAVEVRDAEIASISFPAFYETLDRLVRGGSA